ncbi:MAG TPA: proline dehydrogenase, partial [Actinomycetota bacterium]|nr:proline dehydrogenase [Actinomycetota bacterium]
MFSRTLLWASEKPRVQKFITETPLTRRVVDRFVAGDKLEDAIAVIKELNSKGIGGILDFLGEGVRDAAGANAAATDYL